MNLWLVLRAENRYQHVTRTVTRQLLQSKSTQTELPGLYVATHTVGAVLHNCNAFSLCNCFVRVCVCVVRG